MPLQKQQYNMSLDGGIDTKTDPKQIVPGRFSYLQNAIFKTAKEIRKRYGYRALLPQLPSGIGSALASYNSELLAMDGKRIYSYGSSTATENDKGYQVSVNISQSPVIRNVYSQTAQDMAYDSVSGLKLFTWLDSSPPASSGIQNINYSVIDSGTGASLVSNAVLTNNGLCAKPFAIGNHLVIIYFNYNGTSYDINYAAINTATPTAAPTIVQLVAGANAFPRFDACLANNRIYIVYESSSFTSALVFYLDSSLSVSSSLTVSIAPITLCILGDPVTGNIWIGYSTASHTFVTIVNSSLGASAILAPTIISASRSSYICGYSNNSIGTFFYQIVGSGTPTNTNTLTQSGTVGTDTLYLRGVRIASKPFQFNSNVYFLIAQESALQPTYFLTYPGSGAIPAGVIAAKIFPDVAGSSTLTTLGSGIPPCEIIQTAAGVFSVALQQKDSISASGAAIYSGTGVVESLIDFTQNNQRSVSTAQNLHTSGGYLSVYDGQQNVEHGFHIYPEGVTKTGGFDSSFSFTGDIVSGSATISNVSSFYGLQVGQIITNANLPSASVIGALFPATNKISIGVAATGTAAGATITTRGGLGLGILGNVTASWQYSATYQWTDNQGQIQRSAGSVPLSFSLSQSSSPITFVGSAVSGSTTITINSGTITGLQPGQFIYATGIPASTYIVSIVSATVTISNATTSVLASATCTVYDCYHNNVVIPTLRLTSKTSSPVEIVLYRTTANGTTFYQVTSLTAPILNSTLVDSVTFVDGLPDQILQGNSQLYTNGGEVDNIALPASNALTLYKNRIVAIPSEQPLSWWYSKQIIPGTPAEFSDLFVENIDQSGGPITAPAALDDKLILFKANKIYYVTGDGPSPNGTNNTFTEAQLITSDSGCIDPRSIAVIPDGLMYKSNKGIYLLDRSLGVQYIGSEVEAFNQYSVVSAELIPTLNQVRFTLSGQSTLLVYDYFFKRWSVFLNYNAVDTVIFNDKFTFIDPTGRLFQETPDVYTDDGAFIPIGLTTSWLTFAGLQGYQRAYKFLILGLYKSPHTLTATIAYDFDPTVIQTVPIAVPASVTPYQFRVFLSRQRCEAVQITLTESQASAFGEGLSLSGLSFEFGIKKGLNKMAAASSFG